MTVKIITHYPIFLLKNISGQLQNLVRTCIYVRFLLSLSKTSFLWWASVRDNLNAESLQRASSRWIPLIQVTKQYRDIKLTLQASEEKVKDLLQAFKGAPHKKNISQWNNTYKRNSTALSNKDIRSTIKAIQLIKGHVSPLHSKGWAADFSIYFLS